MILITPTHASQLMRPKVLMLESTKPSTAATATNTAVQAPWFETALRPIERPSMPAPETNTQSIKVSIFCDKTIAAVSELTDPHSKPKELPSNSSKHHSAGVINGINMTMSQLEDAHNPIGPRCNDSDRQQTDNTRNHSQRIERRGNRQHAKSDLCFHHQARRANESDLEKSLTRPDPHLKFRQRRHRDWESRRRRICSAAREARPARSRPLQLNVCIVIASFTFHLVHLTLWGVTNNRTAPRPLEIRTGHDVLSVGQTEGNPGVFSTPAKALQVLWCLFNPMDKFCRVTIEEGPGGRAIVIDIGATINIVGQAHTAEAVAIATPGIVRVSPTVLVDRPRAWEKLLCIGALRFNQHSALGCDAGSTTKFLCDMVGDPDPHVLDVRRRALSEMHAKIGSLAWVRSIFALISQTLRTPRAADSDKRVPHCYIARFVARGIELNNDSTWQFVGDSKPHVLYMDCAYIAWSADLDHWFRVIRVLEKVASCRDGGPGFTNNTGS
ncbi:hypothetical protein HG530_007012 [Fusarium avenaceum]|nr:hypothetical protein HG530_007012 [Fusarium avenaceum]